VIRDPLEGKVIKNETVVWVDLDNTIAMWTNPTVDGPGKFMVEYGGRDIFLTPHRPNIDLVREYRNRGYFIIFHSANGYGHATRIIRALGLEDTADLIMTKNIKVVDDKHPNEWMGALVYLPEDFYGDVDTVS
jgi:hypothetical protein